MTDTHVVIHGFVSGMLASAVFGLAIFMADGWMIPLLSFLVTSVACFIHFEIKLKEPSDG